MVSVASHSAAHSAAHTTPHVAPHETARTNMALIATTGHVSPTAAQVDTSTPQPAPVEQISPAAQFAFLCLLIGVAILGLCMIVSEGKKK